MTIILHEFVGADPSRLFSAHCWKAALALSHKRLPFERNSVCMTKVPEIEDGVSKTVPVIRDGSRVVADSFLIADYLEETYPDQPSLFGGEGGQATARFVEAWTNSVVHPAVARIALKEIYDLLDPSDQPYFRTSREAAFGKTLEQFTANRDQEIAGFSAKLQPLRAMLGNQPWIGGSMPLFCDYIVFGGLQWARATSSAKLLEDDDVVTQWFERCLDLHDGLGRSVSAARL